MKLRNDSSENVAYNIPGFPAYVRRGVLSTYPNYTAVSHWHDDIELITNLSGTMKYNINGRVVTIPEGGGIFVNTRQLHFGFSDNESECIFICALFHPLLLCTTQTIEKDFVIPVLGDSKSPYCILHSDIAWENSILTAVKTMYQIIGQKTFPLQAQGLLAQIWAQLYKHLPVESPPPVYGHQQLSVLKDMIGYIQKHYQEKISLNQIASVGQVSKSSCYSIFQNHLNQTPIEYLTDYRLKKGIDLMNQTDMTISEIGYTVGFSSASYFAETFRKNFNSSPTQYRKQHKKIHQQQNAPA